MMPYQKQHWSENPADDTPLSAQRLNHMEDGIESAHDIETDPPDGSVTTAKIADGAVTTPKIATNAVTSTQIAEDAVGGSELASNAVFETHIANSQVTANKIASNAVTTAKVADLAVTGPKLANLAITNEKIADATIAGNSKIQPASIGGSRMQPFTITGKELFRHIVLETPVSAYQDFLSFEGPTHRWNMGVDHSTGQMRFRHGNNVRLQLGPTAGEAYLGPGSNQIWHDGNLDPSDFGQPVTSTEQLLATRHTPNTTMSQIMSVTPGRLGTWLVFVSLDVNLTGDTILVGEVRRSTVVQTGALVFQGPGRTTITNVWRIPITTTAQNVNVRVNTTNTQGTREVIENQSRIVAHWLHP